MASTKTVRKGNGSRTIIRTGEGGGITGNVGGPGEAGGHDNPLGGDHSFFEDVNSEEHLSEDNREQVSMLTEFENSGIDYKADPEAWGKQRTEAASADLQKGVESLVTSEDWEAYLETASKFHTYSFSNQVLIAVQARERGFEATRIAGRTTWRANGRFAKKGETGLVIFAPRGKVTYDKKDKNGNIVVDANGNPVKESAVFYKTVKVLDISQTEGDPLPENPTQKLTGDVPEGLVEDTEKAIKDNGFTVEYSDENMGGANGYTDFKNKRVVIKKSNDPAQQAKTALHELGHIELGHGDLPDYHTNHACRGQAEVEAESYAFMVAHINGMKTGAYSFGYVAGWSGGDPKKVKETGARVQKAVTKSLSSYGWRNANQPELAKPKPKPKRRATKKRAPKPRKTAV